MKSSLARIPILAAALLLPGCAFLSLASQKLKPPDVAYDRAEVLRVAMSKADVNFHTRINNPNVVGLQNVRISYQLFHEDRPFLKGNDILIDLAPRTESPLVVPTEIVYTDVYAASSSLVQRVLAGDKNFPVRIDLVISGNPTLYDSTKSGSLFPFTVKLSRTENIPIPQEQIDRAKKQAADKAVDQLRRRF
jgi:LEA14-like dessication related protein